MLRRRLVSAALAAALLAADLVLLALFLNPEVSAARELVPLLRSLLLPYWAIAFVGLLLFAGGLELLRAWPPGLRPPVPGLPSFTSFTLAGVSAAALLYALNLEAYRDSIPLESARALSLSARLFGALSISLLGVGLGVWWFPQRRLRGASAALVVLAAAALVVVPLAARPRPGKPPSPVELRTERVAAPRRVLLLGADGLSPALVREGARRGVLPAFARLLRKGTHAALGTLSPTEGPPVWTSIVTGRLPREHGVKSFTRYRLRGSATLYDLLPKGALVSWLERAGLVSRAPVTAASRKRRAVWEALNAFGIQVGVVRLFATHPAQRVQGFMLSNYFYPLRADAVRAREALHPGDLLEEVRASALSGSELDAALVGRFLPRPPDGRRDDLRLRDELLEHALAPDLSYERAGRVLRAAYDPPFFASYLFGLDVVTHAFLRHARPEEFGNVPEADVQRYGTTVDRYAAFVGERAAELADTLRGDDILLLVSGYGMHPVPWWRRTLATATGALPATAEHAGGASGFLLAVGNGVRAGAVLDGASVLDLAPTILYLMGLPVARDMEGRALVELLDPESAQVRPVTFIPSYESLAVAPAQAGAEIDLPPLPEEVR